MRSRAKMRRRPPTSHDRLMLIDQAPGYSNKTNPYNALLCDSLVNAGHEVREYTLKSTMRGAAAQILHVHWPEEPLSRKPIHQCQLRFVKLFLTVAVAKAKGAKIFWTAHNLFTHEHLYPSVEARFYKKWIKTIDGVICMSEISRQQLVERYPGIAKVPTFIIPHGDYKPRLNLNQTKEQARQELNLPQDARIVGMLGAIRPYKNTPKLVANFLKVAQPNDYLLIGGRCPDAAHQAEIDSLIAGSPQVRTDYRLLPDDLMETYSVACDLLAVPYKEILNSGTILYGLSLDRHVLAPVLGSLPEVLSDVGPDWVRLYEGEFTPEVLASALEWATVKTPANSPDLSRYSWDKIGQQHIEAYQKVRSML